MFSVEIKGEYSGGTEGFFCISWESLSKVGHVWIGLRKCFHLGKWLRGVYIYTHKWTHTHSDISSTIILCTTKYLAESKRDWLFIQLSCSLLYQNKTYLWIAWTFYLIELEAILLPLNSMDLRLSKESERHRRFLQLFCLFLYQNQTYLWIAWTFSLIK